MAYAKNVGIQGLAQSDPVALRSASRLPPSARAATPAPTGADSLTDEQRALLLDVGQILLDVVGLFEPTPFADATNALISAARSDWTGAGISLLGTFPYIGDAAKAGKFPQYLKSVERAVCEAQRSPAFSKALRPVLAQIRVALYSPAIHALPAAVTRPLLRLRVALDIHLGPLKLTNELVERMVAGWQRIVDGLPLPRPGKDNGILWSKIGAEGAKEIADELTAFAAHGAPSPNGVVTLEKLLDAIKKDAFDFEGTFRAWYDPLAARFENADIAWQRLGMPVWTALSRRYVALLEGRVRVYVNADRLGLSALPHTSKVRLPEDAVLYDEIDEITELMEANRNIASVVIHDARTHSVLQVMESEAVRRMSRTSH